MFVFLCLCVPPSSCPHPKLCRGPPLHTFVTIVSNSVHLRVCFSSSLANLILSSLFQGFVCVSRSPTVLSGSLRSSSTVGSVSLRPPSVLVVFVKFCSLAVFCTLCLCARLSVFIHKRTLLFDQWKRYTECAEGLWFGALHGKLQLRLDDITKHQTDVFHWTEILRDIFLPVSLMYKQKISKALQAINPEQAVLWSTEPYSDVMRSSLDKYHVLILNNAKYGHELQSLSEEDILEGPAVLSQILRRCLGMREPL